jgi:type II secretory ATPase GspE/PulE/Tfp pilus assembly ATPase PilB-like protein
VEETSLQQAGFAVADGVEHEGEGARSPSSLRIGELLLRRSLIGQDDLGQALAEQESDSASAPLGRLLVRRGAIDEKVLTRTLAEQAGMSVVDLDEVTPDRSAIARLPREAAFRLQALPLHYLEGDLVVALAEPPTRELRREVLRLSGRQATYVLADTTALAAALEHSYPHPSASEDYQAPAAGRTIEVGRAHTPECVEAGAREADPRSGPAPDAADRVVAWLLSQVARLGASSVHLLDEASAVRIRVRVDGGLCEVLRLPHAAGSTLIRRVLLASHLDTGATVPQVGSLRSPEAGFGPELCVATSPTAAGRTVVVAPEECWQRELALDHLGRPAGHS